MREGAKYGLMKTDRSWIRHRLRVLSGCLLLPTPVRETFLFRADEHFYRQCTTSVVTLQAATRRVIEHLGLECDTVIVGFRGDIDAAGRIQREGRHYFVELHSRHREDALALGAILAHEVCHVLLDERGVEQLGSVEDEVHVDLAALVSGLGTLTMNGMRERTWQEGNLQHHEHRSFGYLPGPQLRDSYVHVTRRLGLSTKEALRWIRVPEIHTKLQARLWWSAAADWMGRKLLRRAPAPALPFGVPPSHVVVRCLQPSCDKRLRVPAGARGEATCPACRTHLPFDGTLLTVAPRLLPLRLREELSRRAA